MDQAGWRFGFSCVLMFIGNYIMLTLTRH